MRKQNKKNIANITDLQYVCLVFCRGMLSAAHVLAMDAKNLLDVVDAIRQRYDSLFVEYFENVSQTKNKVLTDYYYKYICDY